jgi:toxin CptA
VHRFTLRPSAILAAILLVAHTAAVAVLFLLDLPTWTLVAGAAVLICNLLYVLDAVLLRRHDALVAIEITSERGINAQSRSGKWSEYEVLNDTFVSAFLSVLRLKDVDGVAIRRIVILRDSIDREDFRQLRVTLRWK